MAKPYREGAGWCVRQRYRGEDIYLSGLPTQAAATKAARQAMADIEEGGQPKALGPHRTTLAQALQDYATEHLPRLKGAAQEARRLNKYILAGRLARVEVSPAPAASNLRFVVELGSRGDERRIPNGLGPHRKTLLTKTAGSDKIRQVLAQTAVARITRRDLQQLMDALSADGLSAATIALERALLRGFFNYARGQWNWLQPADNPATGLKLPKIDNGRERVLSLDEQRLLDPALEDSRNEQLKHVVVLLRETAMRASEPLLHATWGSVDWKRNVLSLSDGKDGRRDVPLSPAALDALQALRPGKPGEPIVSVTYEALKAGMRRACERAGIENLHLHDLRHTAATRLALDTGNEYLVKALTGHKTPQMVKRYVNVTADDVVAVLHRKRAVSTELKAAAAVEASQAAPDPVSVPGLFTQEQVQALVAKAVADAMAAALPSPAPAAAPGPAVQRGNVIPFRRAA